jgi:hypothetical protein
MVVRTVALVALLAASGCSDDSNPPVQKDVTTASSDQFAYCATSCAGCCSASGACETGDKPTACGTGGAPCIACGAGQSCVNHSCGGGKQDSGPGGDLAPACSFEVGCGDSTKWCDAGKCVACATGKANCDLKGQCECDGTCNGTTCSGTKNCDYYDLNVCGGDTSKWCWQNACTSCTTGWFNCNQTKGCECDSAGCNGTACAGKCSGGEC